jgi:hypothetical protein
MLNSINYRFSVNLVRNNRSLFTCKYLYFYYSILISSRNYIYVKYKFYIRVESSAWENKPILARNILKIKRVSSDFAFQSRRIARYGVCEPKRHFPRSFFTRKKNERQKFLVCRLHVTINI